MDFSDSLDLCLSCGNHVAEGTPYCSTRCLNLDRPSRYNLGSRLHQRTRSSSSNKSHSHFSHCSNAVSAQRRPLLDYQQDPTSSSSHSLSDEDDSILVLEDVDADHPQLKKLASIAEWAEGVWGGAASSDEEDSTLQRRYGKVPVAVPNSNSTRLASSSQPRATTSASASASTSSPKPSSKPSSAPITTIRHTKSRPKFTLSVAHVAPPAMSITTTTTSLDDDNSSVMTPSSAARSASSSSPRLIQTHKRKPSSQSSVDPWIASPPYEFAYNHGQGCAPPMEQILAAAVRGRTLARA